MERMKTSRSHGLIIDQDGREVGHGSSVGGSSFGPSLGQSSFRQSWSDGRLQGAFQHFGFNTSEPLTVAQRVARIEALATLLDVAFMVPGTRIRFGIDGIFRLVPVAGNLIAAALSLWIVREARALGAPWHVTARMLGNVAIDGVVGMVPLAGDAFDVLFRANIRNIRLLRRWLDRRG